MALAYRHYRLCFPFFAFYLRREIKPVFETYRLLKFYTSNQRTVKDLIKYNNNNSVSCI
jgi:hypothetical protein